MRFFAGTCAFSLALSYAADAAAVAPRWADRLDAQTASGAALAAPRVLQHDRTPRSQRAHFAALQAELGPWRASWDPASGSPVRTWGRGLAVPRDEQASFARALLGRHLALFAPGASLSDFVLVADHLSTSGAAPLRTLAFEQRSEGVPVSRGERTAGVSFRFIADKLVLIAGEAVPHVGRPTRTSLDSSLDAELARASAEEYLVERLGVATLTTPTGAARQLGEVTGPLLLAPSSAAARTVLRVVVGTEPVGRYAVYVDAITGEGVGHESLLRFAQGTVLLDAPERWPGDTRLDYPAQRMALAVNGASLSTDAAGMVSWPTPDPAAVELALTGPWVRVLNDTGPEVKRTLSLAPDEAYVWSEAAQPTLDAQLVAFVHTQRAKERILSIDPTFAFPLKQIDATVNIADQCNAYSDGTDIHFFAAGGPCENTGRLADVVHHEYGHSVHANAIIYSVGAFEGALSEGLSDYLAATMSNDSAMGRGFFFSTEPLREVNPLGYEHVWPDDISWDTHETGLIIAGALWDLRERLVSELGPDEGVVVADHVYFEAQRRAVDIPTMYHEALVADDDDGDLENGTPHVCAIDATFGAHGLKAWRLDLEAPTAALPTQAGFEVSVKVTGLRPECGEGLDGATLRWRRRANPADDGEVPMTLVGDSLVGQLPSNDVGEVLEYQVVVKFATGEQVRFPRNQAAPRYELFIGEVVPLYCTDFETDPFDGGWVDELLGPDGVGKEDWQWGDPTWKAKSGDPDDAFSGTKVLGNDLGKGSSDGTYASDVDTRVSSPVVDTQGFANVRLQYRRWLNVEDGYFDRARIRSNGKVLWENLDTGSGDDSKTHHQDGEWRFHDVDLTSTVANGQVQVSFDLTSDDGFELGGWTLDDVCIVGFAPPVPPIECGNAIVEDGEECDDGSDNGSEPNACRADCTLATCGDGVLDAGEECDDGGVAPGDGCSATCRDEAPPAVVEAGGGCACEAAGRSAPLSPAAWLAVGALVAAARRRRSRARGA
jgi:cysteine-rich repeat protein